MKTSNDTAHPTGGTGTRWLCAAGFFVSAALIFLGGIWPSLFTLIAIPTLPAPVLFLIAVFRPTLVTRHKLIKWYLILCCIASILSWTSEILWLVSL